MSFKNMNYQINDALGLIMCKPNHDLCIDDLYAHQQDLLNDPAFYVGINALYDYRLVNKISGNLNALMKIANTMKDRRVISKASSVAVIIDPNNHSLMQVFKGYQLMVSNSLVKCEIFSPKQYDLALKFVGIENLPSYFH